MCFCGSGGCYSSENVLPRTHAFAFPIRKRMFLSEYIAPRRVEEKGERLFFLIDVVDAHEGAGEGGDFAEGYEEGFVDLALGVDEDATKEHYQAAYTEEGGGEELDG